MLNDLKAIRANQRAIKFLPMYENLQEYGLLYPGKFTHTKSSTCSSSRSRTCFTPLTVASTRILWKNQKVDLVRSIWRRPLVVKLLILRGDAPGDDIRTPTILKEDEGIVRVKIKEVAADKEAIVLATMRATITLGWKGISHLVNHLE